MAVRGAAKWVASIVVTAALILVAVLVVSGRIHETDLIRGNVASGATIVNFDTSTSWTVPQDVSTITIAATGETGAHNADSGGAGGPGITVTGTVTVTPGERLIVRVASGAGDCSGVFRSLTTSGSIIVAAGGGGAGEYVLAPRIMPRLWLGNGGGAVGARASAYPAPPGGTPGVTPDKYLASWPEVPFSGKTLSEFVGFGGFGGLSGLERPNYKWPHPGEPGGGGSFLAGGPGGRGGTSEELKGWIRSTKLLSSDWPVILYPQLGDGGRGGTGGCGYIGGQGGQGGSSGAGGGGGGGGLSFIEQSAINVSSIPNTMGLRTANVTISYTPVSTSTITLVTSTVEATTTSNQTSSASIATTTTSIVETELTPSASTIPTTTPATPPTTIPAAPTYRAMNTYSLRTIAGIAPGVKLRSAKVASDSRSVCFVFRNLVVTQKAGTCKLTATVSNGRSKQKITATITVAP